ncbi:MAG: hypothetical protein KY443_05250 [Actinobacteria bacterium]|nr:hypothetical protein [Actinomycetota bacterium]
MRRPLAMGLVVGLLAVGAAGCNRDTLRPGEARLTVTGRALVGKTDGALEPVSGTTRVRDGDRVKLIEGTAEVEAPGRTYELRCRGDRCADGSDLRIASRPTLLNGDLLVTTDGAPVVVEAAGSQVEVNGTARVSRSLAVSAVAYRGDVVLRSGGRPFTVPALRQAAVPARGVLPTTAPPLAYDEDDQWDRRLLGQAIAFGRELEARSHAFGASLRAGEGTTAGFYRQVLPALDGESSFDAALLRPARPAGETLVGAVIAVKGEHASFTERWRRIFSFRDEGAAWGLVALDQAVSEGAALVRELDVAIGRAPLQFAAAPASDSGSSGGGTTTATTLPAGGGSGGSGGGGGSRPRPNGPSTTTTTQPPSTTPTTQPPGPIPPPPETGLPADPVVLPLVEPTVDTLNGLLP